MTTNLDERQRMFLLTFLSELGSGLSGPGIGPILYNVIRQEMATLAPDITPWEIIWGPAVFQVNPAGLATNIMYVARSGDNQIAVVVAGTNPSSYFDWVIEDWQVERTVPWEYGSPVEGAAISEGSAITLGVLQEMRPAYGTPGTGLLLLDELRRQTSSADGKLDLTVTGHSLGGALSPAVALWLMETQSEWDADGRTTISSYAYAGPTTGNAAFAQYGRDRLGERYHRVGNTLDLSSISWEVPGLEHSKTIYAPVIPATPQVTNLLDYRISQVRSIGYEHLDPDAKLLEGSINTALLKPGASIYENYHIQSGYQHVEAYFSLLGIPQYVNYQWLIRAAMTPLALGTAYYKYLLFESKRLLQQTETAL